MKINRPTEDRPVKPFGELCGGDCFEFCSDLYVKTANDTRDALLLRGANTKMEHFFPEHQCILVDVEISYAYRRQEGSEEEE